MTTLNTNIDDYDRDELLELVDLPNKAADDKITEILNGIVRNYIKQNNYKFAQFFHEAKEKLLGEDFEGDDNEPDPEAEAEQWLTHQYRTQDNVIQNDKITNRNNKFSIFQAGRTTNPVMSRQTLGINNTIPLDVAQDGLNPTLRQTISRLITVDSQYRPLDIPYTFNPNDTLRSATNFTINLTETLKNVLSITLETLYIPSTWYTFDPWYRNTCMWILTAPTLEDLDTGFETDVSCSKICITPGTYKTATDLVIEINQDISNCGGPDINGGQVFQAQLVNGNITEPTIQFFNLTGKYVKVLFYREDLTEDMFGLDCSGCARRLDSKCPQSMTYRQNLGYYLGFRITKPDVNELSIIIAPILPLLSNLTSV